MIQRSISFFILFCLTCFVWQAWALTDQNLKLALIDGAGNRVPMNWPAEIKWGWIKMGEIWEPQAEVWLKTPAETQLAPSDQAQWKNVRKGKDSFFVLVTTSPRLSRTLASTLKTDENSAMLSVDLAPAEPALLVHQSCKDLGIAIKPEVMGEPFLYLGAYCSKLANGRTKLSVSVSDDASLIVAENVEVDSRTSIEVGKTPENIKVKRRLSAKPCLFTIERDNKKLTL